MDMPIDLTMPSEETGLFIHNSDIAQSSCITFSCKSGEEVLRIDYNSGDIFWRGKLVQTNQVLCNALLDIVYEFRCPTCKERMPI